MNSDIEVRIVYSVIYIITVYQQESLNDMKVSQLEINPNRFASQVYDTAFHENHMCCETVRGIWC